MTHRTSRQVAAAFVVIVPFALGCENVEGDITAILPADEAFSSTLSGAAAVPAVTTTLTGSALFSVVDDTFFVWRVDIQYPDTAGLGVNVAHVHSGAPGVNGGIVVTLLNLATPRTVRAFAGQLIAGQFKASVLDTLNRSPTDTVAVGYDALLTLLRSGNAYIDVHTTRTPGGEIRGQIAP
ncbi:MAG TPA: CHRD domain-containing protein [Gemmatimonadales bacterium]|nr:CHRD domain-containing protein [Gemmatimonadales bacterium]